MYGFADEKSKMNQFKRELRFQQKNRKLLYLDIRFNRNHANRIINHAISSSKSQTRLADG